MSANSLTKAVMDYLTATGYKVWRNNTVGVWDNVKKIYRKNKNQLLGTSDIIGFHKKTARFIAVEIKIGKDKLSPEQIEFLSHVKKANGIAIEAKNINDFIKEIESYA